MRHGPVALLLGAALLLVAPAIAPAKTKTVQAGPFGRAAQQDFQQAAADANAFFRRTVTIRRGDRVRWRINGFHNIMVPPRGDGPPGLVAADPARPVAGVNDAAGVAFWFNGQPSLLLNPLVAFKQGGGTYNGRSLRASGLPGDGPPAPYTLRFTRKGTFNYYCDVHAGMKGAVKVVGRRARVPSARQDRNAAGREMVARLDEAEELTDGSNLQGLQNTIQAGNDTAKGTSVFKFFPAEATTTVGQAITLQMPPRTTEVHTFSFGPSNGENLYLDQIADTFISPIPNPGGGPPTLGLEPRAAYPSENPAAAQPPITATMHGNGFFNTGILDGDAATPVPSSMTVRFGAPGTYPYICLIHPFMRATIRVT
jgi:plastocyanin